MKKIFKVFCSIFGLGAVILLVFHLVMLYGLTQAMREVILPQLEEESGIAVKVGRLSINVANGKLFLNDVEVQNPEGFLLENMAKIERVEVAVDIRSLIMQKPLIVKNVEVENALINVIRNKKGELNINAFGAQSLVQHDLPSKKKPATKPDDLYVHSETSEQSTVPQKQSKPFPEILIEKILCNATVRYVDLKLNQLDIALRLQLDGQKLSTCTDSHAEWGTATISGSLGNRRTSFVTDLKLNLAPVTNAQELSFDLTGRVMEIDPQLMSEIYESLNIRSAPFGFEPNLHCRFGRFMKSQFALHLQDIQFESGLSHDLGGIGSIKSLRFVAPVEGSLSAPVVDFESAISNAIGQNTGSILDALFKGAAQKEAGLDHQPETLAEAAIEVLGEHIEEIGESETVKKVLKDLAEEPSSATNAPASIISETLVEILGEHVDEIGESEELKEDLKHLGEWLFGK